MEQKNTSYEWFSPKGTYDWYAPNFPKTKAETPKYTCPPVENTPPVTPPPAKRPRRKRTGMKITMIVICVLILVAGTALAFSEGLNWDFDYSLSLPGIHIERGESEGDKTDMDEIPDNFFDNFEGFGGFDNMETPDPQQPEEDSMPEDFRDFFDSYYTMEETIEPSQIERAETAGSYSLKLYSEEGETRLTLQQIYAQVSPSVVGINTFRPDGTPYGWGTGVIIDAEGYIVTNAHVLSNAGSCSVVLWNGKEIEALLVGSDSKTDLAVLKIKAKGLVPASFGNSDELSVGDEVAAIGNPLGANLSGTLTNGIISAINRNVDYLGTDMDLIQTNAALNEGNSGGTLINMYGQVVGITSMKMSNNYYDAATIEGIGFAIPSTTVKEVVDMLISKGAVTGRPTIGITSGTVPQQAMDQYGLPEGLYITEVDEKSDAWAKGILPGDVLTHVNGIKVTTTDEVIAIRDGYSVGDYLRMTIYRNGETLTFDVMIYDANAVN